MIEFLLYVAGGIVFVLWWHIKGEEDV